MSQGEIYELAFTICKNSLRMSLKRAKSMWWLACVVHCYWRNEYFTGDLHNLWHGTLIQFPCVVTRHTQHSSSFGSSPGDCYEYSRYYFILLWLSTQRRLPHIALSFCSSDSGISFEFIAAVMMSRVIKFGGSRKALDLNLLVPYAIYMRTVSPSIILPFHIWMRKKVE